MSPAAFGLMVTLPVLFALGVLSLIFRALTALTV